MTIERLLVTGAVLLGLAPAALAQDSKPPGATCRVEEIGKISDIELRQDAWATLWARHLEIPPKDGVRAWNAYRGDKGSPRDRFAASFEKHLYEADQLYGQVADCSAPVAAFGALPEHPTDQDKQKAAKDALARTVGLGRGYDRYDTFSRYLKPPSVGIRGVDLTPTTVRAFVDWLGGPRTQWTGKGTLKQSNRDGGRGFTADVATMKRWLETTPDDLPVVPPSEGYPREERDLLYLAYEGPFEARTYTIVALHTRQPTPTSWRVHWETLLGTVPIAAGLWEIALVDTNGDGIDDTVRLRRNELMDLHGIAAMLGSAGATARKAYACDLITNAFQAILDPNSEYTAATCDDRSR